MKMKKPYVYIKHIVILFLVLITMGACQFSETDFGYNGSILGTVKDSQGNIIASDVLTNNIIVNLKGNGDMQPIQIRVKGDGTFENSKIFPNKYKIWISGPVVFSDTIVNDFSVNGTLEKQFTVVPYILPKVIKGTLNGTSVIVDYSIVANLGKTISKSEIYCSTAKYPTSAIGTSTPFYSTITTKLTELSGTVTISGLSPGIRYYIRIGSLASGTSLMNYSNQIMVTIP